MRVYCNFGFFWKQVPTLFCRKKKDLPHLSLSRGKKMQRFKCPLCYARVMNNEPRWEKRLYISKKRNLAEYSTLAHLKHHFLRKHHPNGNCPLCGAKFMDDNLLWSHVLGHLFAPPVLEGEERTPYDGVFVEGLCLRLYDVPKSDANDPTKVYWHALRTLLDKTPKGSLET